MSATHWDLNKKPTDVMQSDADNIFKCIFSNKNDFILNEISVKFVPMAELTGNSLAPNRDPFY